MGWEMPWYSAQASLNTLLVGHQVGLFHLVCYLRQGSNVIEPYWTTSRGVEAMDNSYDLLDLTVYGRQETWEDSPTGWPQRFKGMGEMKLTALAGRRRLTPIHSLQLIARCAAHQACYKRRLQAGMSLAKLARKTRG
jgi:hypothetical protein